LTLHGKPTANLSFQTSYTLSHVKSNIESGTRFDQDNPQPGGVAGQNIPDLSLYSSYYADANYDVRQRFSLSGLYTLPGLHSGIGRVITSGWELTTIAAIQSGTPFCVVCANATSCHCHFHGLNYAIAHEPT